MPLSKNTQIQYLDYVLNLSQMKNFSTMFFKFYLEVARAYTSGNCLPCLKV